MKFCTVALFFCLPLGAQAIDWPALAPHYKTFFASLTEESFFPGVEMTSQSLKAMAIDEGEIIFFSSRDDALLPSLIGNFAVIEHNDNIRAVYGFLKEERPPFIFVETREEFSQWEEQERPPHPAFLALTDMLTLELINPRVVLPLPTKEPRLSLEALTLVIDNTSHPLLKEGFYPSGEASLFATIYENEGNSGFHLPYSISLDFVGNQIFHFTTDVLKESDSRLVLPASVPLTAQNLYASPHSLHLGDFFLPPGIHSLDISLTSITKRNISQSFLLRIKE